MAQFVNCIPPAICYHPRYNVLTYSKEPALSASMARGRSRSTHVRQSFFGNSATICASALSPIRAITRANLGKYEFCIKKSSFVYSTSILFADNWLALNELRALLSNRPDFKIQKSSGAALFLHVTVQNKRPILPLRPTSLSAYWHSCRHLALMSSARQILLW